MEAAGQHSFADISFTQLRIKDSKPAGIASIIIATAVTKAIRITIKATFTAAVAIVTESY